MTTTPPARSTAGDDTTRTDLPDGVRVLVAGGHDVTDDRVLHFATELGRALMRTTAAKNTPVVLVTGGRTGSRAADAAVVRGAREALTEDGGDLPRSVVTFRSPDHTALGEPFDGTLDCPPGSGSRQARRFAMTAAADVVVCINGGHGTAEQATLAMALGRPCLPLPFTGGRARDIWDDRRDGDAIRETFEITDRMAHRWRWEIDLEAGAEVSALASEVADLVVDKAALPCFVSRPYQEQAAEVHADVIAPAIEAAGMRAVVSEESHRTGPISDTMLDEIARSFVMCAYLTDDRYAHAARPGDSRHAGSVNPNVMYEAGFACGRDKQIVLLAVDTTAVPFNLRCHRFIAIGDGVEARAHAREKLAATLADIRGRRPRAEPSTETGDPDDHG
ncbi:SLOG cluster 4 domain-containing protein [Geodermatophilus sp. SYSU D00710]